MSPAERISRNPLVMPLATLLLTILIQLIGAAFVYGQLSTTVSTNTDDIKTLKATKLDKDIYYYHRDRELNPDGGAR